jgi:hypothetical protein
MPASKKSQAQLAEEREARQAKRLEIKRQVGEALLLKKTNGNGHALPVHPNGSATWPSMPVLDNEGRVFSQEALTAYFLGEYSGNPCGYFNELLGRYLKLRDAAKADLVRFAQVHDLVDPSERREHDRLRTELAHLDAQVSRCHDLLEGV